MKKRYAMPARLDNWTVRRAASFCRRRVDRIKLALQEIAVCYDEVDAGIGWEANRIIADLDGEDGLLIKIAEAEAEGRSI